MNKYIFIISDTKFVAPKEVNYNEIQHKILNENIQEVTLVVISNNITEAVQKANKMIEEIVLATLNDYPNIQFYKFLINVKSIEELHIVSS